MVTLDQQIAAVAREIAMRKNVYPKWVASKRMKQEEADHQIAAMEKVIETLNELKQIAELAAKASPAPWERDLRDTNAADQTYAVVMGVDGKALFDTCNSEVMEIGSEPDEDSMRYWDEQGKRDFDFICTVRNWLHHLKVAA
jgi:hypothetical protein